MIKDVITHKLRQIPDERGRLMEIIRKDQEHYLPIAQVYMTTNYPGVIKAWWSDAGTFESLHHASNLVRDKETN